MGADCCGTEDPIYDEINTEVQSQQVGYHRFSSVSNAEYNQNGQNELMDRYDEYETKYDHLTQQYQAEIEQKLRLTNQIQVTLYPFSFIICDHTL